MRTASIPAFAAIVENVTDKTVSDRSSFLYVMLVVDGIFFLESANRIATLSFALRLSVWMLRTFFRFNKQKLIIKMCNGYEDYQMSLFMFLLAFIYLAAYNVQ